LKNTYVICGRSCFFALLVYLLDSGISWWVIDEVIFIDCFIQVIVGGAVFVGGGAAAAAPAGGAAPAGDAAPAPEKKEEKVEEESDDDMGLGLFD